MRTEIKDGVRLHNVRPGSELQVTTRHTCYRIRVLFGRIALISGHPLYCPRPVLVTIHGSTLGGSTLNVGFIGYGMRLEFHHPQSCESIVTSTIREIREFPDSEGWNIASVV